MSEVTCLAILRECLHLCCLDPGASDPNCSLDNNCGYHCEYGCRWEHGYAVVATRQQLLYRLLEDLEKRNHHDDGEDEDANGLKALATDGESFLQGLQTPAHQLVRSPDDDCAKQVEGGVNEGRDQG